MPMSTREWLDKEVAWLSEELQQKVNESKFGVAFVEKAPEPLTET